LKLKVGHNPGTFYGGIYLAVARGYFAEEGFEIELEPFDSGERTIPSLATGQVDVAGIGLSAGIYGAVARGAELKIVAGATSNEPGYTSSALAVRKDLYDSGAIRELSDLRGRSVAQIAHTVALAIGLSRGLQSVGLTDADVNVTLLPFADQLPALANGAIDVGALSEPFVTRGLQQNILVRWKGMDEIYPYHQLTVIAYSPQFIRDHADAGPRFLAAYLRGARDYVDAFKQGRDKAGVIQVLAEYTPIKDTSLYERMVPSGMDPDGGLNLQSMEYDQDWYIERGHLREKIELSRVVDLSYREAALQRIGRYTPRAQ
jgi:NitT/TauT family transport system substrate-binding protein